MKLSKLHGAAIAAALLFGMSSHAVAQANTAELAAGGGFGSLHSGGSSTNKFKFTAAASYNILDYLAAGFEYQYSGLNSSATGVSVSGGLSDYGLVVRGGPKLNERFQPYGLFAGGLAHGSLSANIQGFGSASAASTGGYIGFGGGVNYFLGGGFGVRPEVRYQHLSISSTGFNEFDITASLFYNFGGVHKKH